MDFRQAAVSFTRAIGTCAKKKGANDLFADFLTKYHLPSRIAPLVKLQLVKFFDHYNAGMLENDRSLKTELANVEQKLKSLKIRHGLGEIDKETFDLTFDHLSSQMQTIGKELNTLTPQISNLENLISHSLEKLENLSQIWVSSDLENKRTLQKTLFPDGVYYNVKNHQYLTRRINSFLDVVEYISKSCEENKNGTSQSFLEKSRQAPPAGDYSYLIINKLEGECYTSGNTTIFRLLGVDLFNFAPRLLWKLSLTNIRLLKLTVDALKP